MEQNLDTKCQSNDCHSNIPPLTKWECIHQSSKTLLPVICGHRGQVINNHLIVAGGYRGVYSNATYRLNLDILEWNPLYHNLVVPSDFSGRQWHSVVKYNNRLYVFGGAVDKYPSQFNDIFEYNPATCRWQEIRALPSRTQLKIPSARYVHGAVVYKNCMYIHGGKADTNGLTTLGDFWKFNFDTRQWTEIFAEGEIPLARRAHLTVVYERKMYVFGGWNGTDYFDDAYYYHFKKNTWFKVNQQGDIPPARQLHTGTVRGGIMYVFGGKQEGTRPDEYTGDLLEFEFSTHTWKKINVDGSHLARGGHVMFEFGDYLYILGGYDGTRMSDLWRIKLPEVEATEGKIRSIKARLRSDMKQIFKSKEYSDLVIRIDQQDYHLHSALLRIRCPKLLSLIQNDKTQTENLTKFQMNILIQYIYEDHFAVSPIYIAEMAEMHALALNLELPYLASFIEDAVIDILDRDNLLDALSAFTVPRIHKRCQDIKAQVESPNVKIFPKDNAPIVPIATKLSENFLELLLQTGAQTDITIIVNDQEFKLHKFILCRRCPFFKGFAEFNERNSGSVLVHKPHMPFTAFKALVKYIYGAKISCDDIEDYFWLLQEASYYMIDDKFFYQKISKKILKSIEGKNAKKLLNVANKFNFNGIEEIMQAIHGVTSYE